MKAWLLNQWDRLRNSLWFVPAAGLMAALAAAVVLLQIDSAVRVESMPALSWATTTGPAARATLATLAGGLMTIAGVVFSIMMLTLAQTSSMFGSRLLRSFLNHNITQLTLALFLGTSLYCFAVLWTIREIDGSKAFVPNLSISVGLLAGLACLATFVYFIHHVAASIQAQTVAWNVATELNSAIDRIFPEEIAADNQPCDEPERIDGQPTVLVESQRNGYVQAVDEETLLDFASGNDLVIRLRRRPGDFVALGIPIAEVYGWQEEKSDLAHRINECFLTGSRRTPRQDVECAIEELGEVAVRALSPGINDPHTAIACIDYLGAALIQLVQRRMPSPVHQDEEGRVRVIVERVSFADTLNAAFDEIRQYGRSSASVTIRLVDTLLEIARKTTRPSDRDALLRQAAMLERGCEQALPEKYDRADVQERLRKVREVLSDDHSSATAQSQPEH
jgi:uncharacterized membrane protein